ncbi:MAG: methane monooxygenase/ammonia monooxygenase subunit A [Porticoccaceae bacterium]|nr:methane monooxygenase/ammonia monooxygenase subunit A [Porticoccaceae bacterium]
MNETQASEITASENKGRLLDMKSLDNPRAMKLYRRFDGIIILVLFMFLVLGIQIHFTLTAGDWDYWIDWRDRRWWPLVAPFSLLIFIGPFAYGLWARVRLPIAGTVITLLLCVVSWVSRYLNFYEFTHFPMSFVFPSTYIGLGILLDCTLLITRSLLVSAITGGALFGALVWPLNWSFMAASKVPVELNGMLLSVADLMGYQYIRTTTPEYLRIIEESTLRTFGGSVTPLTAVFSGLCGIVVYGLFLWIGARVNQLEIFSKRIV